MLQKAVSLPKREQWEAFAVLRKLGIYQHNRDEMKKENPNYCRERSSESVNDLVVCSSCKGFYKKSYKARHQIHCGRNSGAVMMPTLPMQDLDSVDLKKMKPEFRIIMNQFLMDDVGDIAKTDQTILVIGLRNFNKRSGKSEKIPYVQGEVRKAMRLLARLLIHFRTSIGQNCGAEEMFKQCNFSHLTHAIDKVAGEDENMKCGTKTALQHVIKNSSETLELHYFIEGKKAESEQVKDFRKAFAWAESEIFGSAIYRQKQKRNKVLRKPEHLPSNSVIKELMSYIQETTRAGFEYELPASVFVNVRDATCSRLTIYNGRRGGEPARLFLYQWQEALEGTWLRPETRTAYVTEISTGNLITFQEGKGSRLVPIFFPADIIPAIKFLSSADVRSEAGIRPSNQYVFASTKDSDIHVSGWHALQNCCKRGNVEGKITGTLNRHRLATLIGSLGLSEKEQNLAFEHFGHSGDVNREIYQAPQAEQQLASTGKYLKMIDQGVTSATSDSAEEGSSSSCTITSGVADSTKTQLAENHPAKLTQKRKLTDNHTRKGSTEKVAGKKGMRGYFLWNARQISAFDEQFKKFVDEDYGYPNREQMEKFGQKFGVSVDRVRTRIINDRAQRKRKANQILKKNRADLEMDI